MYSRIVEIASKQQHLSLYRGFLHVSHKGAEVGRIAIADIGVLLLNAHGLTYSQNLLVKLAEEKIPTIICGSNHQPKAWLWPAEVHYLQARRMDAQISCSKPTRKRLWQQLVKKKITFQGDLLHYIGQPGRQLKALTSRVRSGDTDNIEAQAARRYWPLLFGEAFKRDRESQGINALLNYGYTIVRSAVARAVMCAGLHPTIAINHANKYNAFRLVDDLIEPFRVSVDSKVFNLVRSGICQLDRKSKECLVELLYQPVIIESCRVPLFTACHRLAMSLARVYSTEQRWMCLPDQLLFGDTGNEQNPERVSTDVDTFDV